MSHLLLMNCWDSIHSASFGVADPTTGVSISDITDMCSDRVSVASYQQG